jgi:hypothetical protein
MERIGAKGSRQVRTFTTTKALRGVGLSLAAKQGRAAIQQGTGKPDVQQKAQIKSINHRE